MSHHMTLFQALDCADRTAIEGNEVTAIRHLDDARVSLDTARETIIVRDQPIELQGGAGTVRDVHGRDLHMRLWSELPDDEPYPSEAAHG